MSETKNHRLVPKFESKDERDKSQEITKRERDNIFELFNPKEEFRIPQIIERITDRVLSRILFTGNKW